MLYTATIPSPCSRLRIIDYTNLTGDGFFAGSVYECKREYHLPCLLGKFSSANNEAILTVLMPYLSRRLSSYTLRPRPR